MVTETLSTQVAWGFASWDSACTHAACPGPTHHLHCATLYQPAFTVARLRTCAQGDIEAVAAKSPSELTHLFEQISGSDAYKRQYDELQKAQAKAEEKVGASVGEAGGRAYWRRVR